VTLAEMIANDPNEEVFITADFDLMVFHEAANAGFTIEEAIAYARLVAKDANV